jgi:hypothetical protein
LTTLDIPIEEFYRHVRDAQNEEEVDPYIATFIDCLIASTDYDSFYRVMSREGKRSQTMKALLKTTNSSSSTMKSDEKHADLRLPTTADNKESKITTSTGRVGTSTTTATAAVAEDKKGSADDDDIVDAKRQYK